MVFPESLVFTEMTGQTDLRHMPDVLSMIEILTTRVTEDF